MFSWTDLIGGAPAAIDGLRLRQALGAFPTGVCLVTTVGSDGKREGMTINSFASVSLTPPLILWSIRDEARSADVFLGSPHFILSVLTDTQQDLAMHFAKPAADKFARFEEQFSSASNGCPRLRESVATFECTTYSLHQEGDHTIIVGKIQEFSHTHATPLLFHAGQVGSIQKIAGQLAKTPE